MILKAIGLAIVFALTFGAVVAGYYTAGPWVETQLFPVTSKVTIHDLKEVPGGLTFRFSYRKLRNCELVTTALMIGDVQRVFRVVPGQDEAGDNQRREPGVQLSRLWFADIPALEGVEIRFIHRCVPTPWLSVTRVYP